MSMTRGAGKRWGTWMLAAGLAVAVLPAQGGGNAGNVVLNGPFMATLNGWDKIAGRKTAWIPDDSQGVPDSGAAMFYYEGPATPNGSAPFMAQCLPLGPQTTYTYGAWTKLLPGQQSGTFGWYSIDLYASTDCTGSVLASASKESSGTDWSSTSGSFTTTSAVRSGYITLGASKPPGTTATTWVMFDSVYVRQAGLPFQVGPWVTGSWYNPAQSGHGITLDMLSQSSAWLCWFTFDSSGNRTWICGVGSVSGATITYPAFLVNGGKFPPAFDPSAITETPWGTITTTFTGCNKGTMSWTTSTPGYSSGSMPLARLANPWASVCPYPD